MSVPEPTSGPRHRDSRVADRDALHLEATALALIVAAVVLVAVLTVASPPAPPSGAVRVVLSLAPGAARSELGPDFWGINVGANVPVSSQLTDAVRGTPVELVRWPGGAAGDELNYTSGLLTDASGARTTAPIDLVGFVAWCRSVNCRALLELPGEIDDPATAAYDVAYTERTLGFDPVGWEVGNEPALWTHFGLPWSAWNASQHLNATPASYAGVVHSYGEAIHRVDPSAPVLGLAGVGTGGFGETTWIAASLAANGANVSGVGIHVYPAGETTLGSPTPAAYFANASGPHSFAARVTADRAAVAAADPSRAALPLDVTELGSGNSPGGYDPILQGYDNAVFVASELVSALDLNVSQVDLTQVQTPQAGMWFDANGTVFPLFTLYHEWLGELGTTVVPVSASPYTSSLRYALTTNGSAGPTTLLVVNLNLSVTATVDASGLGFSSLAPVEVWSWNATSGAPSDAVRPAGGGTTWTVPPLGLLMLRVAGPPSPALAHARGAGSSTTVANALSISTAEGRWRWEICSTLTPSGTSRPSAAAPFRASR